MRKDVECLFGILQSRFHILLRENQRWPIIEIICIGNCCVILHNFLIRFKQYLDSVHSSGQQYDIADMICNERNLAYRAVQEQQSCEALRAATRPNQDDDDIEDVIIRVS